MGALGAYRLMPIFLSSADWRDSSRNPHCILSKSDLRRRRPARPHLAVSSSGSGRHHAGAKRAPSAEGLARLERVIWAASRVSIHNRIIPR
jgi:hypothetical protein